MLRNEFELLEGGTSCLESSLNQVNSTSKPSLVLAL